VLKGKEEMQASSWLQTGSMSYALASSSTSIPRGEPKDAWPGTIISDLRLISDTYLPLYLPSPLPSSLSLVLAPILTPLPAPNCVLVLISLPWSLVHSCAKQKVNSAQR
jgi:hypothetical protein